MRNGAQAAVIADRYAESVIDLLALDYRLLLEARDGCRAADLRIAKVIEPFKKVGHGGEQAGGARVGIVQRRVLIPGGRRAVRVGPSGNDVMYLVVDVRAGHSQRFENPIGGELVEGLPGDARH